MSLYLNRVRTLPCCICGDPTSTEAAHIRYSEYHSGKVNPGKGQKPQDCWIVPLCSYHHRLQHHIGNERLFWKNYNINPITYAILLYQCRADINKLPEILKKSKVGTSMK